MDGGRYSRDPSGPKNMAAVACEPILKAAACFYKESKGIEENGDFLHKMFLLITTGVQTKQRVQICIDGNVFSVYVSFLGGN